MNSYPNNPKPLWNPYIAGILLGLALVVSYLVLGVGLGASGGIARIAAFLSLLAAPEHTVASEYFGSWGRQPLLYYLVFMFFGTIAGASGSALSSGRFTLSVEKGSAFSTPGRLGLALFGGILVGFASRMASGCTSGQALTGGAMLLTGSLLFLFCLFASGYAVAGLVKRQWQDN